ncbi:hypothetical protein EHS25_006653 [Saitozyma podzolica]|uniref:Ribosome biogenesis protein NSA1 n=1 Tax=Saitozyma podzolica TaxID=1890683 RepID=A0A427YSC4_9TREE|nr:hypothetical protein EHS25_006653 [Saitozyma podzolica]
MIPTLNFLAPSLHPNTVTDITFPLTSSATDPIVRHLAIKHGEHAPVGLIKRISSASPIETEDQIVVADDAFRISTLRLSSPDEPAPPEVVSQHKVSSRPNDIWTGLVNVQSGHIASLTSGLLAWIPSSSDQSCPSLQTTHVPSPVLALASHSPEATSVALAGKEVDVSLWDVERTFAERPAGEEGVGSSKSGVKRKNAALEPGEIWRAKNLPNDHLSLRPPIHHLSLAFLPSSPHLLVSGTKSGSVRGYDTRQRKPVSDWRVAKEGGVGCVCPGAEHELFFSDRSNLLASLDLRTGKILYNIPSTSTAHHLVSMPPPPSAASSGSGSGSGSPGIPANLGLATISSDASLRVHSTTPPPEGDSGNWRGNGNGKKGGTYGMVGGVGVGGFICSGWGEISEDEVGESGGVAGEGRNKYEDGEDDEDEEGEEDDEEVWEGMSEVEDQGALSGDDDEEEEEESEEDEDEPPKRAKKGRK